MSSGGNTNPVFDPATPGTEIEELEHGKTGSSRANLMLVGGSPTPTTVIAYEESKGAGRVDSGKLIRYHEFPFNQPQAGIVSVAGEPGCILSDPFENSRRVHFVSQPTPPSSGLRMAGFWRQGKPTEGGLGDIMVRTGMKTSDAAATGLRPEDMQPPRRL